MFGYAKVMPSMWKCYRGQSLRRLSVDFLTERLALYLPSHKIYERDICMLPSHVFPFLELVTHLGLS